MFRKENLLIFAIIGVAALYGLFSLIIFFTRGRLKRMVKQKIALGIMLITFVGIFNGCSLDTLQVDSGKSSSRLLSNAEVLAADPSVLPSTTGTLTQTPTPMCYTPAPTITPTPTTQPPTPMCYTPTPPPTPTPTVMVTATPTPMCYTQAPTMTPTPTAVVTATPTPMCYTQAPTVTPTPTFTPTVTATPTPMCYTQAPTVTPTPTLTPTVTSTPTSAPTPTCYTQAPTLSPTPTFSPTVTPTPTLTGSNCTVPVAISGRFVKDGSGEFCWTKASVLQYINSWNLDMLEINGKVFTNMYVAAASLPAKINGLYYIHYKGRFPWSHVEIN